MSYLIITHVTMWTLYCLAYSTSSLADENDLAQIEHSRWTLNNNITRQISALTKTRDGYLWLATQDGLYRFDGLDFKNYRMPDSHELSVISSMLASDFGLWVGLRNGVIHLITSMDEEPSSIDLGRGPINALAQTPDGSVWAAANHGLMRFDGKRWQQQGSAEGFLGKSAYSVFVDSVDRLWVADEQRLYVLTPGESRMEDTGVRSQYIRQMAQASDGALWLIERGSKSLLKIKTGQPELQTTHVAISEEATTILFDQHGCLWLSTAGGGLFHVTKPNEFSPEGFNHLEKISSLDGLSSEFSGPLLEDDAGSIWVGTQTGLDRLRSTFTLKTPTPPKVYIESLDVDGRKIPPEQKLKLPENIQALTIQFSALNLLASEDSRISYTLEGHDHQWHAAEGARKVTYNNLSEGEYLFKVRIHNPNSSTREWVSELGFTIAAKFYHHPLFILFVGCLVIIALRLIYRMNLQLTADRLRARLEERHLERERIARDLHDTLLQGVQGLMLHVQAAVDSLPAELTAKAKLDSAMDRIDQVISEGRDRVSNLRTPLYSCEDLPQALKDLEHVLSHNGISYNVLVNGSPRNLHPVAYDEIYQIAREAIRNAFQHAHAHSIQVELEYVERAFRLSVIDDGRGILIEKMQAAFPNDRWGLIGMYERASKIGGTLIIRSTPNEGSEVKFTLPAKLAYPRKRNSRLTRYHE
ncbi:exported hypothetical protein [Pseudomonas sp. 8O]|nr:exported hypothetical protein [Pseudomonas sp. 8O]